MARELNRLPPRAAAQYGEPGRYSDGGGLYLVIGKTGGRKWVFRYKWRGQLKDMGLGSATTVLLSKARVAATAARVMLADGIDPMEARRATQDTPTFGVMVDIFLAGKESEWRSPKHGAQWRTTLTVDAARLAAVPVDQVDTALVLEVLKPIWTVKPETASRLRGRIERVLDAAKAKGFRSGENPALWRGHLDHLLARRQKLTRGHHAALPYTQVTDFVAQLRARDAIAALALEFAILTAARSGEVRGATWAEIDLDAKVWVVPGRRMKAGRDHRVPLSARAVEILEYVRLRSAGKPSDVVFPSIRNAAPLSDAAFSALFDRMKLKRGEITAHGFRSSFRDWAGEETDHPREVAEAALAHVVGDATERAYRRGDALEKRRMLMDDWAKFCDPQP